MQWLECWPLKWYIDCLTKVWGASAIHPEVKRKIEKPLIVISIVIDGISFHPAGERSRAVMALLFLLKVLMYLKEAK